MKNLFARTLIFALFAIAAFGQTTTTATTAATTTETQQVAPAAVGASSYSITAGTGFSRTSDPKVTGFGSFAYCRAGVCPYTTWSNITGTTATIVAGLRYNLATQGPLTLFLLADAGMATTDGAMNGAFAGGGGVDYALEKFGARYKHCYLTVAVQGSKVGTQGVHPAFSFGFKYSFGE